MRKVSYQIAENEFKKESLEKLDNLAAQLFNIENSSIGQLDEAVAKILQILKHEVPQELQRDFGLWLRGLLRIKENDFDLSKIDDMEVKPMLAETIKKFEEECILKGKLEGELKGKLEGKLELAKKMLGLGVAADIIAKASGLKVSEINKLLNQIEGEWFKWKLRDEGIPAELRKIYREFAVYLIKLYTDLSQKAIGKLFDMNYRTASMPAKRFTKNL